MASVPYVQQKTKRVLHKMSILYKHPVLFHKRSNISRRENLHGNRQPNNWDLNDVVYLPPP